MPSGRTITYGELAALAGSPGNFDFELYFGLTLTLLFFFRFMVGAQQAVGTVMAANPFQLVVPCHRVVKSGLKVGKYSGGRRNSVKVWLLQHEGFIIDENGAVRSK